MKRAAEDSREQRTVGDGLSGICVTANHIQHTSSLLQQILQGPCLDLFHKNAILSKYVLLYLDMIDRLVI